MKYDHLKLMSIEDLVKYIDFGCGFDKRGDMQKSSSCKKQKKNPEQGCVLPVNLRSKKCLTYYCESCFFSIKDTKQINQYYMHISLMRIVLFMAPENIHYDVKNVGDL